MNSFDITASIKQSDEIWASVAEMYSKGVELSDPQVKPAIDEVQGSNSLDTDFIESLKRKEHLGEEFLSYYRSI